MMRWKLGWRQGKAAALTASMVAAVTGADKATARRNPNAFAKLGLIREITGQARYMVWVVAC